jgi:hypothetical protein
MRTKTLLLTAAISAAGLASSMAQAVYSVNAVGYVNYTLRQGYNLVSNPLNAGAAASSDTIAEIYPPQTTTIPDDSFIVTYNSSANAADPDLPQLFNDAGTKFWFPDGRPIRAGEAFLIYCSPQANPATTFTVTYVGEVREGAPLSTSIVPGPGTGAAGPLNFLGSQVPQQGRISTDLGFQAAFDDTYFQWDKVAGAAGAIYQFLDDGSPGGAWYDANGPAEPVLGVGDGFFLSRAQTGPTAWTRSFDVTP